MFEGFEIGGQYHLHRQMWPVSREMGTYTGGIASAGTWPNKRAVAVLATVGGGRYGNHWDGDDLVYSGEDRKIPNQGSAGRFEDQRLDGGNNRILFHQASRGYPLYVFWKTPEEELWRYEGLGTVVRSDLVLRDNRLVALFRIRRLDVASSEDANEAEAEVERVFEAESLPEPALEQADDRRRASFTRLRNRAFAERIKRQYGYACAVCGAQWWDARGRPEVEAAHVHPRGLNGADDPRNALAMCRFHHWAFDGFLFVIEPDLRIRALNGGDRIPGVAEWNGRPLSVLPRKAFLRPHALFLSARIRQAEAAAEQYASVRNERPSAGLA